MKIEVVLTNNKGDGLEDERDLIPGVEVEMTSGSGIRISPVVRYLMDLGFIIPERQISFKKLIQTVKFELQDIITLPKDLNTIIKSESKRNKASDLRRGIE